MHIKYFRTLLVSESFYLHFPSLKTGVSYGPERLMVRKIRYLLVGKKQNCYNPIYLCASETVHKPSYLLLLIPETLHKYTYIHPLLTKQPNELGNRWETESPCVHTTTMPITCWVILRKPHILS
uniref:Uncharacterized protein n=1 Tax=Pipistrellus kuhlii TaxID=59472 RepID=A0A7J7ZJV1_PIPKU|nr:hypothetical protein mPipKuh1_009587 [Pipistrellus kuhlii]